MEDFSTRFNLIYLPTSDTRKEVPRHRDGGKNGKSNNKVDSRKAKVASRCGTLQDRPRKNFAPRRFHSLFPRPPASASTLLVRMCGSFHDVGGAPPPSSSSPPPLPPPPPPPPSTLLRFLPPPFPSLSFPAPFRSSQEEHGSQAGDPAVHTLALAATPRGPFSPTPPYESRILTPGGSAISPGGAGPPASPSPGHYHPPAHSPPLVKVSFLDVGYFIWVSNDSYSWLLPAIPTCPGFSLSHSLSLSLSLSLSGLLPESSAISEFDATSAIRYRPRKSDCSLWSRNNCVGLPLSGEAGIAGNGFANRKGGKERNEGRARARELEKPRSKFNAERFLVRAPLRWTALSTISLIKKKISKRRVELESGILSRVYVKLREINFKTTRRKEAVGGAHYGIGRLVLPPAAAGDGGSCFTLFDFFKIYPYRFLAKSLSGRNLRSGNNTEGASPGELHTVRDYGIRAKEGADGGTGRSEELGLSTAVQPSNGDLTYIPGTFPASSLPD
ncbi:hypothetical protein ALC60_13287 [Trachymyrmex zeteki]|uniref:Uncharacterized protein n=1 Tax=Mycetomoellerius zeteki TaxID=64791 RepID=A0A151WI61_9HYME|nr:hypothetical protein ALC60_13287 [Trachymyrmex zeteki]